MLMYFTILPGMGKEVALNTYSHTTAGTQLKQPGLEVINLEFILNFKIKCNDWLLADMCRQAANPFALF